MNPIKSSESIKEEFISYVMTQYHIADHTYAEGLRTQLEKDGNIAKGPYLDITDSFQTGMSITGLIQQGEMSTLFSELEGDIPEKKKEIKLERPLYLHQEKAIRKINQNHNLIVTTGTGSGKTECFILPILNHLLREKERGTLSSGVRAILIYPMNALANDQMKRLRDILKNYPEITFGVYNGSTKKTDAEAREEYEKIFKDEQGQALKPLPNEILSRASMQKNPPHILVTNYAMLEYMMLRPNDDKVFSGAKLRFLVLDEAHSYSGTKGMETSLLLRRLKARISNPKEVLHILTSATLGGKESDQEIVSFAETLCDAKFQMDDIIRSKTVMPPLVEPLQEFPMTLFAELEAAESSLNEILDRYHVSYNEQADESEILFDLCTSAVFYKVLRQCAAGALTIKELTARMREQMPDIDIEEKDIVNFITVAAKTEKNKTALMKVRYHMFIRALEGAYITIGPRKEVFLNRCQKTPSGDLKVFEAAVCDDCGRVGIVGKTTSHHFEFASNRWEDNLEIYLLRDPDEHWEEYESDDAEEETEADIGKHDYLICAKCGKIMHESQYGKLNCECDDSYLVHIRRTEKSLTRLEHRCPSCSMGHMKTFYLGYDAATAVLGMELYEQLPEQEVVLKKELNLSKEDNIFGSPTRKQAEIRKKARQFLAFSDSRSDAAFFACNMTKSYQEFLRRRGLWHVVMRHDTWEISDLIEELTAFFDEHRTFAEPEDKDNDSLTSRSRRQAWIAVLNEIVNARRSTSLVSLGVLDFVYKRCTPDCMPDYELAIWENIAKKYNKSLEDVMALFQLLVMDILYNGAVKGEADLTGSDREYIYYTAAQRCFVRQKGEKKTRKGSFSGWLPSIRKNGRIARLMRVLNINEAEAKKLLEQFWDGVLLKNSMEGNQSDGYYLPTEQLKLHTGMGKRPVYQCDTCGRVTMKDCENRCTSIRCNGTLHEISFETLKENNHFARMYAGNQMKPLHIKEHTAQLGRKEQQHYQKLFVDQDINALSCSTTFEMGVDVGTLETVYLRDMPPTPANYVQRAGRAGRSLRSAAYALTYAKLSSHDFTYFAHPERMISGKIGVPVFSISNEKVVLRHMFAIALSSFFSLHEDVYADNDADVFLNRDGYEKLDAYLSGHPESLKNLLKKSIPDQLHRSMGIDDWSWISKLLGNDGVLRAAVIDFRNIVAWYEAEKDRLMQEGNAGAAARCERKLEEFRKNPEDCKKRKFQKNQLIDFLVRNNVLPKYGFPVDTVELYQNIGQYGTNGQPNKELKLIRDLQQAVAEYAPGSQVVADGRLYTSRYIRKLPQTNGHDWEEVYIAECKNETCRTWNHRRVEPSEEGEKCISCQQVIKYWEKAIEPRKGFVAESKSEDVPIKKPERLYRSEDFYIGDLTRRVTSKKTFVFDGGDKVQFETSVNDSLMVVCQDNFHVCDRCGYTISSKESGDKKGFSKYAGSQEIKHESPWGKECTGKLYPRRLCHAFKTDVVRIVFGTSRAKDRTLMLSVMYALLEAVSEELHIERTDLKGCLHKVRYQGNMINAVILYDAVAGGAGHVKRLVTDDGKIFQKVVQTAIDITKNCQCDPSCYHCLRNYYNQSVHDFLDRKMAYQFLAEFKGTPEPVEDTAFE